MNKPLMNTDVLNGWGVSGTIGGQPALSVFQVSQEMSKRSNSGIVNDFVIRTRGYLQSTMPIKQFIFVDSGKLT